MDAIERWIRTWIEAPLFEQAVGLVVLLGAAYLLHFAFRRLVLRLVDRIVHRSSFRWDDALHRHRVFERLVHLIPLLLVYFGISLVPDVDSAAETVLRRVALASMIVVVVLALGGLLGAINDIYSEKPENRTRPIQGYLQLVKLFLYIVAGILVVATLMDRSPLLFLSGLGALSAVLLLVFRDTLLSMVASVRITDGEMIHVGDWIEMPQYGADGDVIDIALHSVKVQNWDKTITAIPTHKFLDESFKNWRGMSRSGGRRIKRSIFVDMSSVRFLEPEEVERFEGWALLRQYVAEKRAELARWNEQPGRNPEVNADIRRLTNLGTLRAYIEAYLKAHPHVHQQMTLLVRQLQPGPSGLPIEIYCFTNTTEWGRYEAIQADIFDHVLAMVGEFDLRVFQDPSGRDVVSLGERGVA